MTKSTITRERAQQIFLGNGPEPSASEERELARMALAAMDSEPVAIIDQANLDYLRSGADADVWPPEREEMGDVLLYRHAQPAPEYPETLPCPVLLEPGLRFGKGIKTSTMLAALARRAVHESDMAALSPEERVEFQARIEDFKALIAQPAPVVPDAYVRDEHGRMMLNGVCEPKIGFGTGWNACRAAMLQAEPVTMANKLPDDFDFDRFNDVTWLECVASNPHMHSPTTSTIARVALELNKRIGAGNSPAQSDCCPAQNVVAPAQSPIDHGYLPECECSGCKATARICTEMAVNSLVIPNEMTSEQAYEIGYYYGDPVDVFARGANWMRQHIIDSTLAAAPQLPGSDPATVPGKWIPVSELMPPSRHEVLVGCWWGEKPRWCCKWATYIPGHPDAQSSGWFIPGASWTPTHWMPLPAAPQEVK